MTFLDSPTSLPDKAIQRQREIENQLAALHSPLPNQRASAARRLGDLQAGLDDLLDTLQDPHDYVRGSAANALGSFSNDPRAPEIVDYLLAAIDDPSEKVCQAAIRSLGLLRAGNAREQIMEFLDDPSPFITGAAILALARLGDAGLTARLEDYLRHSNHYIRMQAARAAGVLKFAPAGPEIVRMLQETRQLRLQQQAQHRLAGGYTDLSDRLEWREDELYSLQNHLIRTAGELRLQDAVPILIDIAQNDIGLRGLAVEALIEIGAPVAPELLASLLTDPSIYLRKRLIQLMTQFDYRPALPLLRPLLRDGNASTRSTALQAITQMQDTESGSDVLWMAYHDSNPFVRIQAVRAIVVLLDQAAGSHLASLTGDANVQVRREAAAHLLNWNEPDESQLTALARFALDLPEDELTPAIARVLQQHSFDPTRAATLPSAPRPALVPAELRAEIPDLLARLETWKQLLEQQTGPEAQKIDAALAYLIKILSEG